MFLRKGSYTFQWIIFLNVYLHWIILERGNQVILLRFNIIKVNSYFYHPVAEQRVWVTEAGQTEVMPTFYHLLFLWSPCVSPAYVWQLRAFPVCLIFPGQCHDWELKHLFFIPYGGESVHNSFQSLLHPKWFNVMYFSSRHLIFNKKQCAMTERNKRISRVEYQVLETIQKARIRAIYL